MSRLLEGFNDRLHVRPSPHAEEFGKAGLCECQYTSPQLVAGKACEASSVPASLIFPAAERLLICAASDMVNIIQTEKKIAIIRKINHVGMPTCRHDADQHEA